MLAFLAGGWAKVAAIGGAILAGLLVLWRVVAGIKQSGRDEQRAADAVAGLEGRLEAKEKVDDAFRKTGGTAGDDAADLQRLRDNRTRARGP